MSAWARTGNAPDIYHATLRTHWRQDLSGAGCAYCMHSGGRHVKPPLSAQAKTGNAPHAFCEKMRNKNCTVCHWLMLAQIRLPWSCAMKRNVSLEW